MAEHPAIPAATLILFREHEYGVAEHLFVERSATMVFAAGALVFPGGRVDEDDRLVARAHAALDPDDAAARVAAIRETLEEAGVAIGFEPSLDEAMTQNLRAALASGTYLSVWLEANAVGLNLDALVPFARWRPNFKETRSFDTRFYIARVPATTHEASVDATENVHLFWAQAAEVLALAEAGDAHIIFPTMRNLERLASVARYEDAMAHLQIFPSELIIPFVEERDGERHLCIPDGLGYPVTARPLSSVKRG